ncbi:MAG: phosphoglucomutase/phosphomannomutase family protein [PVC group bacterium]|nr:phosphoglucomutase/phosphomannomutase family protein [PVC group bacterium]
MHDIKFGTDGFRGIIAEDFTFLNVALIGKAIAYYMRKTKSKTYQKGLIVGYDRRFLSDKFAQCISKEISDDGVPVLLTDTPVSTPAVSAYIRSEGLLGGIIITASHNPPNFNGIKIKNEFGASAEKFVTEELERYISSNKTLKTKKVKAASIKKVKIISPYIKSIKKYLDFELLKKNRFNVVVDAMHGVGQGLVEETLKNTGCKVTSLNSTHDPLFGGVNPEPIAVNLPGLITYVRTNRCDLGIALDGDGDRVGAMCPDGRFINSHYAICLILIHLIENRKWTGRVLKSINTTTMVDKITQHYNLKLEEVPVGFKNIASEMLKGDVLLGGEESGGIGFKNYMPERDGVLSGLLLLEMMAYRKQSILKIIQYIEKRFGKYEYLRRDLKLKRKLSLSTIKQPRSIIKKKVVDIKTYDGIKFILEDESWLIIRASGTEPIVRIYAESGTLEQTRKLIDFGCRQVL